MRTVADTLTDTNPNTCDWTDLFNMWLFELGDNPMLISEAATTIESLKQQEGYLEAKTMAINKINNGDFSITNKTWQYGQGEFYTGMQNGNIATSFLGTYTISITTSLNSTGDRIITIKISNPSSWASATRLRIDNDGDGNHDEIIPSKSRGTGINLGGNFKQNWEWTEKL